MILWVINLIDSVSMHPALYPLVIKADMVLNKTGDHGEWWSNHGLFSGEEKTCTPLLHLRH